VVLDSLGLFYVEYDLD
jgi:hypothetical protein